MQKETAHIIVIGNEKGGAGKTTMAMHVVTNLLYDGHSVGSIDIDSRQRSLSNYLENRQTYIATNNVDIPVPSHFIINKSNLDSKKESNDDEKHRFLECLNKASSASDFVVIDSPGNDTFMSRLAHSYADTIITPINDSFVDLNVLARVSDDEFKIERYGVYSDMIWEAKICRAQRDKGEIDWIVLRNRLTNLDAKNKRNMLLALNGLAKRVGCRLADGFSERVIYRELFLKGMTLLDIIDDKSQIDLKISHIAARQELRKFMDFLNLKRKISQQSNVQQQKIAA